MKEIKIEIAAKEYMYSELCEADRLLVDAAKEATRASYSPYSRFKVGAAILMENGDLVTGANQENAAYPSGTCAERTTAFYAAASHPGMRMLKIAIAAWTDTGKPENLPWEEYFQSSPISPCGACRQALLEYEAKYGELEVILYGKEKILVFPSIASLLPFCFTEF